MTGSQGGQVGIYLFRIFGAVLSVELGLFGKVIFECG
jgi:hypothetical protein